MSRVKAVIALGSNLGDRGEHLTKASEEIGQAQGVKLLSLSPIVESNALTAAGFDESKPKYLNSVAIIEADASPAGHREPARKGEA